VNRLEDTNIYRTLATGEGVPTEFIASTRRDERSSYAPDGRIAFASDRSGSWEIWIAGPDGSSQVRVTNFGGPLTGFPRWSPDGRHLAFESKALGRSRIFVLECQSGGARCGKPMPLTSAGAETLAEALPSWSADGVYVYFTSNRTGRDEVWKQALAGGEAIQVTRHGGYFSHESQDGKWLYFSKLEPQSIWRAPVPGAGAGRRRSGSRRQRTDAAGSEISVTSRWLDCDSGRDSVCRRRRRQHTPNRSWLSHGLW
jgi:Tol biopolymer transport system component